MSAPVNGIRCVFFVGAGDHPLDEPDTVALDCPDDYDHLPAKVIGFFTHCLENFEFDWLFKCDDDTYVALDRLGQLISPENGLIGNEFLNSRGAPSGGAGYFVSRTLAEDLVAFADLPVTGAEDMIVGQAAARLGASFKATTRLCWNNHRYPRKDNDVITSHWCSPERMEAIHCILNEIGEVIEVSHPHWEDEISLFPGGYFSRHSSSCCGRWREDESGFIHLDWFDWDEEILVPDNPTGGGCGNRPDGMRCIPVTRTRSREIGIHEESPRPPETDDAHHRRDCIAVFLTTSAYGLPHLDRFLELNPEVPVHVACSKIAPEGPARIRAWVNCDLPIRNWWLSQGQHLNFRHAVFLEWDALFDSDLEEIFPGDADFYCADIKKPGAPWYWFSHTDRLPESLRPHATGTPPMAVIRVSRRCLEAMHSHPDAEEAYRRDIQAELRFASLAVACGFEPTIAPGTLSHVSCYSTAVGFGPAVWHAVKQRQSNYLRHAESLPLTRQDI